MNQYNGITKYQNNPLFAKSKNTLMKLAPYSVIPYVITEFRSHTNIASMPRLENETVIIQYSRVPNITLYIMKYSHNAKTIIKELEMQKEIILSAKYKMEVLIRRTHSYTARLRRKINVKQQEQHRQKKLDDM